MNRLKFVCTMVALAGLLAFCGSGFGAKGGDPGPPVGGETPNNLSLPAVMTGSATTIGHKWLPPAVPVFGEHYVYGCDHP